MAAKQSRLFNKNIIVEKTLAGEDPASILAGSVGCGYTISTWVFIYTEALPGGRRSPTSWRSPNVFEKP